MNISIFGLGYVGAVSLACLARDGHRVLGVDIDRTKLDLIASGKTPVVEEGMIELMQAVASSGRVSVTSDTAEAVRDSEISLICVGTLGRQRQPGPGCDPSTGGGSGRRIGKQENIAPRRVSQHARARHCGRRAETHHREALRQEGWCRLPPLLSARILA